MRYHVACLTVLVAFDIYSTSINFGTFDVDWATDKRPQINGNFDFSHCKKCRSVCPIRIGEEYIFGVNLDAGTEIYM